MQNRDFQLSVKGQWLLIIALLPYGWYISQLNLPSSNSVVFSGIVYTWISDYLIELEFIASLLALVLIFVSSWLANMLSKQFKLISRKSFLVLIFSLLLFLCLPEPYTLQPQLLSLPLILYGLFLFFRLSEQEMYKRDLISITFVFSLASLLYLPLFWLVIFIPIGISLFRNLTIQYLLIILLSFILPYFYIGVYYFLWGDIQVFFNHMLLLFKIPDAIIWQQFIHGDALFTFIFLFFLFLVNLVIVFRGLNSYLIQIRRIIVFLLIFTLFVAALALVYLSDLKTSLLLLFLPFAIFNSLSVMELKSSRFFWIVAGLMAIVPLILYFI